MKIELDDLSSPAMHALRREHLQSRYELSPPESVHALDLVQLRTPNAWRRKAAGRAILAHIIDVARSHPYASLSLETGSSDALRPAQALYQSAGFTLCGPFAD